MLDITAYGEAAGQGSKKFAGFCNGRALLVETSNKKLRPWNRAIYNAALSAMEGDPVEKGIKGACSVQLFITVKKPKSAPKRRVIYPAVKPDIDKMCRAVMDALKRSGAIEDDSRVVTLFAVKLYPLEGTYALDRPGAFIRISSYPGASL